MAFNARVFKIMLASPSDVDAEREAARRQVDRWNAAHSEARNIVLLPVGWETNSTPRLGHRPQEILNEQVLKGSDIVIGIFGERVGTPTGDYESGSVEEIQRHHESGKTVKLYFSEAPISRHHDPKQLESLNRFKDEMKAIGTYQPFSSTDDFAQRFYTQLEIEMNQPEYQGSDGIESEDANPTVLSTKATQLLLACSEDRGGTILKRKWIGGSALQANNRNFTEKASAREIAAWDAALEELVEANLVRDAGHSGEIFRITDGGYVKADASASQIPLLVGLKIDSSDVSAQAVEIESNKSIEVTHVWFRLSSGATMSDRPTEVSGSRINLPINHTDILPVFNTPRPDMASWDHSGPALLGVTIRYDGADRTFDLPVHLQPTFKDNTQFIKITGQKQFS